MSLDPLRQNKAANIIQPENFKITRNVPIDSRYVIDTLASLDSEIPLQHRYPGLIFYAVNEPNSKNPEQTGELFIFESDLTRPISFTYLTERHNKTNIIYLTRDFWLNFGLENVDKDNVTLKQKVKEYFQNIFNSLNAKPGQQFYVPQLKAMLLYKKDINIVEDFYDCYEWLTTEFNLLDFSEYQKISDELNNVEKYWVEFNSNYEHELFYQSASLGYLISNTGNNIHSLYAKRISYRGGERNVGKNISICNINNDAEHTFFTTLDEVITEEDFYKLLNNSVTIDDQIILKKNHIYIYNDELYASSNGFDLIQISNNINIVEVPHINIGLNKITLPQRKNNYKKIIITTYNHNDTLIFTNNSLIQIVLEEYTIESNNLIFYSDIALDNVTIELYYN